MRRYLSDFGGPLVSIMLVASGLTPCEASERAASAVTIGGHFELMAPDGAIVTDLTYRGKWLLIYFGYTSCPDTCPTTLVEIAATLKGLGPAAASLQPLFITIDPRRDTAEVLRNYTQSFDPRIIGLTGSRAQIDAVTTQYGAYSAPRQTGPDAEDYALNHSVYLYVMDPQGNFARAFDTSWSAEQMVTALRHLMAQY